MFDQNNPTPQPPNNLPISDEPEDMFAGIDQENTVDSEKTISAPAPVEPTEKSPNALDAGMLKPKSDMAPEIQPPTQPVYAMKEPVLGKVLLLLFLFLILVGLGFGGFWFYNNFISNSQKDNYIPADSLENTESLFPEEELTATATPTEDIGMTEEVSPLTAGEENIAENIVEDMNSDEILFGEPTDSDRDGLDDVREEELGTNPNNSDTDDDELDDASEVLIWKTDPNNPDSDGDGYTDGTEIKAGYNPLGPGKIFETEATTTASSTDTTDITDITDIITTI